MTENFQQQSPIEIQVDSYEYSVAPGSAINIPVTLVNHSDDTDSFQLSIEGIPAAWVATSSPITLILPGEKKQVTLILQPPDLPEGGAGNYQVIIRAVSQGFPSRTAQVNLKVNIAAFEIQGRIGMMLASTQFSVSPGSSVTIPIKLQNRGLVDDEFRLALENIPAKWISTPSLVTPVAAGEEVEIYLTILPPKTPQSRAGRMKFTIRIISQEVSDQFVEVDCTLTIAAFSMFTAELAPDEIEPDEPASVVVNNLGNIQDTFNISLTSDDDLLTFDPEEPRQDQLQPGESKNFDFLARPRRKPLIGGEINYHFSAQITSADGKAQSKIGKLTTRALIPLWVFPAFLAVCLFAACLSVIAYWYWPSSADVQASKTAAANETSLALIVGSTQTAVANLTATAAPPTALTPTLDGTDSDGDGLSDRLENEIGTDPRNPDTDGDQLLDGEEVFTYTTDPLVKDTDRDQLMDGEEVIQLKSDPKKLDTDEDQLSDGEEVLNRKTDPLKADTDDDGLKDGDEVQRRTDPLNPDTDRDQLNDGAEIQQGTDPLNPDSDNDRLLDGNESPPCPNPLNPDSDADGIIDGQDLNPCDPNNPALTATAVASIPTSTPITPTQPPTQTPVTPTITPTPVPLPPNLTGVIAYTSNRDGNLDIYLLNTANNTTIRLTNDPGVDILPAISPNGNRIAFVSNRSGNYDIWIMNLNGSGQTNLTNNPADDQFPTWSPDSNAIAFQTNRDGNLEIYAMNPDGGNPRNLTNYPSADDSQPTWYEGKLLILSTGESIAFTSNRDGNQEIYTMNTDGGDQKNITNAPFSNDSLPAGAPAGDRILFTTDRDGNLEVYWMTTDGTGQENISRNGAEDRMPAWSPDNRYIAFTSTRTGNQEIFIMEGIYGTPINLTNNPASDNHANWR